MTGRKNIVILTGVVLSVTLLAVSVTTMLLSNYYNHAHMQVLGEICQKVIEKQPEAEQKIPVCCISILTISFLPEVRQSEKRL